MKAVKKIFDILSVVVLVALVLVVIFFFLQKVTGDNSGIFGYQVLRVSSGSMEPELSVGDVILSKKTLPETLEIGDIITYNGTKGDYAGKLITHRIEKGPYEKNGTDCFITKGTANDWEDPEITSDQIVGKMQCKIPFIGIIYSFFMTPYGLIAIILVILLAFSNEIYTLVILAKGKVEENVQKEHDREQAENEEKVSQKDKTE